MCGGCGCDRFGRNRFSLGVLQHVGANRIAMAAWICVGGAAKRGVMAAWLLHGAGFGEEAGARNFMFFRVKWLQPAMKGTSCVHGACFGEEAGARNVVFFRVKWLQPAIKGTRTSCVRRLRVRSFRA